MNKQECPRLWGFLFRQHTWEETGRKVTGGPYWPHSSTEGYIYRKCKKCGKQQQQFVETGPNAGFPIWVNREE